MRTDQPTATCARCGTTGPRRGVHWPEGYVCRRCYQQATRRHGPCPRCIQTRLLPGRDTHGQPICADCAGIGQDFHCTRCSAEDEPHRRGLCARCCLRDDLTSLLDDGTGHVPAALTPLLEAVSGQPRPRSALIWLRNPDARRLLSDLARGRLPLTHATFDADPAPRTAMHLRELLVRCGALPPADRTLVLFEAWLRRTLPEHTPAAGRLLCGFATWHHLRRMRAAAEAGRLKPGAAGTARQEITVAGQLLTHLQTFGVTFSETRQDHLDAWLATGPSTRYTARTFVVWAVRNRHLPALRFPRQTARSTPVLGQQQRLDLLRRFLHDGQQQLPVAYRLAAVLLLLYAQPLTRITRLRIDDVAQTGGTSTLRLGDTPAELPTPVAELLTQHLRARRNTNTAANANSPWLFPGLRPGQPLHASYLSRRVRDAGVPLLGGRNSALRQLVLDMPPAVAARALGYSPPVAEAHARNADATWTSYAAHRSSHN